MPEVIAELHPILNDIGTSIDRTGEIALDDLRVGDETFTFAAPASYEVRITNTGGAFVAQGTVTAEAVAECARCLEPFPLTLRGTVEGYYVLPGHVDEVPEEQDYELVREGRIDLFPALLSALAVEAPFAPLHAEDCKGICPSCGANLNAEECGCPGEEDASPFGVLKGMFEERD